MVAGYYIEVVYYCVLSLHTLGYGSVANIQFTTTLVSGNPDKMSIHLTWEHPNTPQPFPDPSVYYLQVTDPPPAISPFMYFKVEDTVSSFWVELVKL